MFQVATPPIGHESEKNLQIPSQRDVSPIAGGKAAGGVTP
jgi:hypothetical protein